MIKKFRYFLDLLKQNPIFTSVLTIIILVSTFVQLIIIDNVGVLISIAAMIAYVLYFLSLKTFMYIFFGNSVNKYNNTGSVLFIVILMMIIATLFMIPLLYKYTP